ncbi:hypothetical protein D3C80_678040 [compost metagenome]
MLVGRNGMQAKATVGRGVNWQGVVMAHQDRLAVAHHQQLGRESAVEGPQRFVVLQRHVRMEACVDALGGAQRGRNVGGLVVQAARGKFADGIVVHLLAVAQTEVDARTGLGGLERCLRVKLVPALVRPAFSWWPAFSGRADRLAVEEHLDLRLPWVAVQHVGVLGRKRVQAGLLEERFQCVATGAAACHHVGVLGGGRAEGRYREGQIGHRRGRVELLWSEFFEQQQLLGERLRTEQRAGFAVGRVLVRRLQGRRQYVVGAYRVAVAIRAIGQLQRAFVGLRHGVQLKQGSGRVVRLVGVGRRVGRRWHAVVVEGGCHGRDQPEADHQRSDGGQMERASGRVTRSRCFHWLKPLLRP